MSQVADFNTLAKLNAYLASHPNSAIRYVAPASAGGSNSNNGLDEHRPKETWYGAYESLPSTGGLIYIQNGSFIGKPTATAHVTPLAKQGIRLTQQVDGSGNFWPGFCLAKAVTTIGVASFSFPFSGNIAQLFPGDPGDGSFPQAPEFDVGVWLADTSVPIEFRNIGVNGPHCGWRLAVSGNPALDPYDPASRGEQVVGFYFENCSSAYVSNDSPQPGWDIGYAYFGKFSRISDTRPAAAAIDSERRASMLVKGAFGSPTANGTPDFRLDTATFGNGGIIYQPGASSWGFDIANVLMESDFVNPLPPVLWVRDVGTSGHGRAMRIISADPTAGSAPTLKVDANSSFRSNQIATDVDPSLAQGPYTFLGATGEFSVTADVWPARDGQQGFARGRLYAQIDGINFNDVITNNKYRNLYPQHNGGDGESGSVLSQPQNATGNLVYTAGVADRWGGTTAWKIASNNGSDAQADFFVANRTVSPGDCFVFGFWAKFKGGFTQPTSPLTIGLVGGVTAARFLNLSGSGESLSYFPGDDNHLWQWYSGAILIDDTSGHGAVSTLASALQHVAPNHDVTFCGARMMQVTDGILEASNYMQNMGPAWQSAVGSSSSPPNMQVTVGKLGVDNTAAATTLGTVVKKQEVFDREGNSLGFVPIYDSIT